MRAVAVTAVVAYHATPWLPGGWAGVDVFFVLSGFLITSLLARELAATGSIALRNFYLRRALRLAPAFAAVLLASLAAALLLPPPRADNLRAILISATYLMNWNRALGLAPVGWLGHTWSLATEEQFYLLWPAALLWLRGRRPIISIMALLVVLTTWRCALVAAGADAERTYNGFDTHADALLIGCLLAVVPLSAAFRRRAARLVPLPLAAAAAILLMLRLPTPFTQSAGLLLTALVAAWLTVAALHGGWFKSILSLAPLRYTGRISYGWYLWHYPVVLLGYAHLPHVRGLGALLVLGSYGAAAASYQFVEKPFLRLKHRFAQGATRPVPLQAVPLA